MESYSTGTANAIKSNPLVQEHAHRLNKLAEELQVLNNRIESFCDRLTGPTPQAASTDEKSPEPNGVLFVAQFGAQRIGHGLDRLRGLVDRMEGLA